MGKFRNKYRINSLRLKGYDYSKEGAYFVTICSKNMIHCFGSIVNQNTNPFIELNLIGKAAQENWFLIEKFHPYVILDQFVIMPNHIHGIIVITENQTLQNSNEDYLSENYKNQFGPQKKNISSIIRGYKSSVKSFALKNNLEFNWQPRFYDRIIRNEKELENIQQYIFENPVKWALEKDNPKDQYI